MRILQNAQTAKRSGVDSARSKILRAPFDFSTAARLSLSSELIPKHVFAFAAFGIDKVKVNSGFRDPKDNARVGGAGQSQHLSGNAMDIDVSGYSIEERKQLLRTLSSNGVTGLGIYANSIHVDLGGRRAWGSSHRPACLTTCPRRFSSLCSSGVTASATLTPMKTI